MSQPAATKAQPLPPGAAHHHHQEGEFEFVDVDLGQPPAPPAPSTAAAAICSSAVGRLCGAIRDLVISCLFSCLLRPPCDDRNEH